MDQEFDLWGDPVPPKREKRGRPTHVVTEEKSNRIAVLRALNWTHDQIASAIGISEPTLRKFYLRELQHGFAQRRAQALVALYNQGMAGNASALKSFIQLTEKADLNAPHVPRREAKGERLGKKEQALLDASKPDLSTSMGELMARRAGGASGKPH